MRELIPFEKICTLKLFPPHRKKEWNNIIYSNMNATRDYPTKGRKSKRERQRAYDTTYSEIKISLALGIIWEKNVRLISLSHKMILLSYVRSKVVKLC